jgi:hypothetical protein
MSYGSERIFPPRKKNWTEGTPQIGIFVRTPDGCVIQWCADKATEEEMVAAFNIMHGKTALEVAKKVLTEEKSR